jgi:phage baseplate assembly protein W
MTVRYLGMNSQTGLSISEVEHIRQSVRDILVTPVGSRVMRREYGSLLSQMIDQPQTPALRLQIMAACYSAIQKWEPRVASRPSPLNGRRPTAGCMSTSPAPARPAASHFPSPFH